MKKILIIHGEPKSINIEIILKTFNTLKATLRDKIILIGDPNLIQKSLKKQNKIKINKVKSLNEFKSKKLNILHVNLEHLNSTKSDILKIRRYVIRSFEIAHNFAVKHRSIGLINCPIDKKTIFNLQKIGVTEYLAKKNRVNGFENMMIYNKFNSVVPLTTHLRIKEVSKSITLKILIRKLSSLNRNYHKLFKIKPVIKVLGLNPHNDEYRKNSEEKKIIIPAIKKLKKSGLKITGPISADTAFMDKPQKNQVIVGMYHDQVLTPFKTIYGWDAINITLGLKYLRVSPDHGVGKNIIGLNKANPESLIKCVLFLDKLIK